MRFYKMKRNWLNFEALQQPDYASLEELNHCLYRLSEVPALIAHSECHSLKAKIDECLTERSLILHIGDCAEPFSDCTDLKLGQKLKAYSEFSLKLNSFTNKNVTLIGRIAGQFTKPRSEPFEIINGGNISLRKSHFI